jgi:hypothetical protein
MIGVSDRYRECFLYVDAEDRTAVLDTLARRFGVEPERRTLTLPGFELDVVGNDARTPGRPDTFVEWGTNVEVYATSAPDAEVVRFVSDLMTFLRSRGHRVVAACDFEDELPQSDLV